MRMFVQAGARVFFNYEKAEAKATELVREYGEGNYKAMQCDFART